MRDAGRPLLSALAFLAAALPAGVAVAQAGPDDILIGEDADNYYYMRKSDYRGSAAEKSALDYRRAHLKVAAGQDAIKQLGFAVDAERFSLYESVAARQKEEMERKVLEALFDQALEATTLAAESAKSLNPWNVNKAIDLLKDKGFKSETVFAALRKIARVKDKPEMAEATKDLVAALRGAKEGWLAGSDAAKEPEHAQLRLALGALKALQGNPELGLVVTGAEFVESAAYLVYLGGQVKDLSKATDDKLAKVAVLSDRLKKDVAQMNAAKKAWQKATGYATAAPVLSEKD